MNTRKSRKQMLKAVSDQDQESEPLPKQTTDNSGSSGGSSTTNNNNNIKRDILRAFLETWLSTKRELGKSGRTDEEIYEEISQRLIDQGYQVSSKLVKHKIANFSKKYQYVQRCEREGKKIEWCNYDIVKQIFDLDSSGMPGIVMIPRQQIKSEDELDLYDENRQANGDNNIAATKNGKSDDDDNDDAATIAQTQTFQSNIKEERVELIEIPDEDTYTQRNKQTM